MMSFKIDLEIGNDNTNMLGRCIESIRCTYTVEQCLKCIVNNNSCKILDKLSIIAHDSLFTHLFLMQLCHCFMRIMQNTR